MIPQLKSSQLRSTTLKSSQYRPPRPKPSQSMLTLKPSDLRPASKKRVNFDHHHPYENQVNRSQRLKQVYFNPYTVNFDPPHKKQVSIDPNAKTKSNSISHTEIKLISTPRRKSCQLPTLKSSKFRCLHTKNKLISIHTLQQSIVRSPQTKSVPIPTLNSSQFRCLHTKNKLISIHTLQQSIVRSPQTKSIPIPTLNSSQFRSPP